MGTGHCVRGEMGKNRSQDRHDLQLNIRASIMGIADGWVETIIIFYYYLFIFKIGNMWAHEDMMPTEQYN